MTGYKLHLFQINLAIWGYLGIMSSFAQGVVKNELEYAVLSDNSLYIKATIPTGYVMGIERDLKEWGIETFQLSKSHTPVITQLDVDIESPYSGFPNSWKYLESFIYYIGFSDGGNRSRSSFTLFTAREEFEDTIQVTREVKETIENAREKYTDEEDLLEYYIQLANEEEKEINREDVSPLRHLVTNLQGESMDRTISNGSVTFDFIIKDGGESELFVRDPYHFSRWAFNYASGGNGADDNITYWDIIRAYTRDSTYLFEPYVFDDSYIPFPEDFSFNSIDDPLFYQGHFNAILQHDNRYIINTAHGAIYRVDEKKITKVARVDLSDYPKLAGKHLFIEDLDKHQLIFFAPVKVLTKDGALPDIEVITEENVIRERFGVLF